MGKYFRKNNFVRANQMGTDEFPYKVEIVAENLFIPWAIDISDEGDIYFTERSGKVRVIKNGKLLEEPLIALEPPFVSRGEGGLLGIALDPDFSQNRYMYVMHTYTENEELYNRIVRLVEKDDKAIIDQVLLDKIPGGLTHNGGRLKIGPDGKLYITVGDTGDTRHPQDLNSLAGKILRMETDGSIPEDNPFDRSYVYSFGHRNPQGLAWNSEGLLYSAEHGQIGQDEINIIHPRGNYGWPLVQGDRTSETMEVIPPLIHSGQTTWAPSGIVFVDRGPWERALMIAALSGEELITIQLGEDGKEITGMGFWLRSTYGRLREVVQAKDGTIYLTTSNMDGRGNPKLGDDKIFRLTLQNPTHN